MGKDFNFTSSRIAKLSPDNNRDVEYRDTGQPGLFLRVRKTGSKVFRYRGWDRVRKKRIQVTIGKYPDVSLQNARAMAAEYHHGANAGVNAADQIKAKREESTFDDLFDIWLESYAKDNIKNWEEDERRYNEHIKPYLGKKVVSDISPEVLEKMRTDLLKKPKQRGGGTLAKGFINRLLIIVSSVYSKAAPRTWNPCREVKAYHQKKRDVFMKSDHLKRFFRQLYNESTPEYLRDYLLLSLATGARRSNLLSMQWKDIDLTLRIWVIPGDESKNKESIALPLIDKAYEILKRRKKAAESVFVFPSRKSKTGHLVEPKRAWKRFLNDAGLPEDYWLHDIRRTMGSWQAISGTSLDIIGRSLGHRSKQATEHYAHLILDPVRTAMQQAYSRMEEEREKPDKVVRLGE